jgi:hypothetical protein
MHFARLALDDPAMAEMDVLPDRLFCQRPGWLAYIAATFGGMPVVARLTEGGETLGCVSGVVCRRFGVRIFGSPFPGWLTPYMGFSLKSGVPRVQALQALEPFVFDELRCLHLVLTDRHMDPDVAARLGFRPKLYETFVSDLSRSEDEIFRGMKSMTRRCIRKAEKVGVTVEEADPAGFAAEFYAQHKEVLAAKGTTPTFTEAQVQLLIEHVAPSGDLLLLRARGPDGAGIAMGIFCGYGRVSHFWSGASRRAFHILRPNQDLHWYALRYWKRRGVLEHEWGGTAAYKEVYGVGLRRQWRLSKSRHKALLWAQDMAEAAYCASRDWRSRLRFRSPRSGRSSAGTAPQTEVDE